MKRMAIAKRPAAAGIFLLLIFTATLNAQTPTQAWKGTVTGDDVFVRSGPVVNAQPITQVNTGQEVTVIDQRPGWYGIKPVAGCYSVVKADYVRPDAENKIGTITTDNVLVRAAGRKQLANKDFNTPQGKLNTGDRVRIIGSVFNEDRSAVQWYVIKPPDRTRFWISANYVKRAVATVTAREDDTAMTPVDRTQPTPVEPAETPETAPTPPQPPGPGLSLREEVQLRRKLQAIETLLNAELKKPVAERNLKALIEQTKAIDVPAESRFQSQYQTLLTYMESEQTQIRKYREAQELVETVLAGETPAPAPQPEEPAPAPTAYDLRGHLQFSKLPPTTAGNRTFVVRMPGSDVVRGYATSGEDVDLTAYVGRVVGLRGSIAYDPTIAADVLRVSEVQLLDGGEPVTAPPVDPSMAIEPPTPVNAEQPETPATTETPDLATPAELDDPAIADLLEPIELPEPQRQETPEPSPLEAGLPSMDEMEPVAAAPDRPGQTPPTAPEPPAETEPVDAGLPEPTAPEPSRPSLASAPAQPDLAPPVAPLETQPVEPPDVEPPAETEPLAVTPEPVTPEPPAEIEPVAVTPEPVTPEPPVEPDDGTDDTEPVAIGIEPLQPESTDTEPVDPETTDIGPVITEPLETEPVVIDTEPVATDRMETEPAITDPIESVELAPDADDITEDDSWGSIRPVAVDPVNRDDTSDGVEIAISEDDSETPDPSEVRSNPEAPATAPPVVVPAPRHGSPMPEEVLVTPDGYEVEYD